jgi:hypothetical protein
MGSKHGYHSYDGVYFVSFTNLTGDFDFYAQWKKVDIGLIVQKKQNGRLNISYGREMLLKRYVRPTLL